MSTNNPLKHRTIERDDLLRFIRIDVGLTKLLPSIDLGSFPKKNRWGRAMEEQKIRWKVQWFCGWRFRLLEVWLQKKDSDGLLNPREGCSFCKGELWEHKKGEPQNGDLRKLTIGNFWPKRVTLGNFGDVKLGWWVNLMTTSRKGA